MILLNGGGETNKNQRKKNTRTQKIPEIKEN